MKPAKSSAKENLQKTDVLSSNFNGMSPRSISFKL